VWAWISESGQAKKKKKAHSLPLLDQSVHVFSKGWRLQKS
jgi:hypothetical protein